MLTIWHGNDTKLGQQGVFSGYEGDDAYDVLSMYNAMFITFTAGQRVDEKGFSFSYRTGKYNLFNNSLFLIPYFFLQ